MNKEFKNRDVKTYTESVLFSKGLHIIRALLQALLVFQISRTIYGKSKRENKNTKYNLTFFF